MKVIIDDKIPYIREAIAKVADQVMYLPGSAITAEDVRDADALIVRTRTRCNRALLEGSRVQFIATATIGFDHLDTEYLRQAGIRWTNCPGCNAGSVAQYLRSSLLLLSQEKGLPLSHSTLGVVGVGHVGTLVAEVGKELGMRVLLCDPPRAERGEQGFLPLEELMREADVITFHTPLVRDGHYPTLHMADDTFFHALARKPIIINTSRGQVVDGQALLRALDEGRVREAIIDVWENEPDIDLRLLERVYLGTPHVAGYSADGKANATRMVLEALCNHFGLQGHSFAITPPPASADADPCNPLSLYNPWRDSQALKENPSDFEFLRGNYPLRREYV
ncbi:MAG: 4-phosphoerythronate dehydrogenase PdxB [Bacteroidaceae bacterium]|nr:4-phosphoerythronate dehydrogenase PdxB [Bacteroidaceae bacterium]